MKSFLHMMMALVLFFGLASQSYAQKMADEEDRNRPPRPDFSTIDIDNSGDVDFDEFSQQTLPHGDPQIVFDDIDADGNGYITEQEFSEHKPPCPPKR